MKAAMAAKRITGSILSNMDTAVEGTRRLLILLLAMMVQCSSCLAVCKQQCIITLLMTAAQCFVIQGDDGRRRTTEGYERDSKTVWRASNVL
jgi:CO dehydrogenase/acetyl-CoA synthase alpha subunit